jgi:hypothetical protein
VNRLRTPSLLMAGVIAAGCVAGVSEAASPTWAARADRVCTTWTAKATAALGNTAPKSPAQAYAKSAKAIGLERAELAALRTIPSPTPAGTRALAAVKTDIAEITVGLNDWKSGNKAGFVRVYNRWQKDFRPHRAFVAAGAKACG